MTKKDPNRRSVLKGLAGTGLLGVGSTLSVSVAAAEGSQQDPITIFEGDRELELARDVARTDGFSTLLEVANGLGYEFDWSNELYAGEVASDALNREVVAYELDGAPANARAGIILARNTEAGDLEFGQIDVEHYHDDGLLESVERYRPDLDGSGEVEAMRGGSAGHRSRDRGAVDRHVIRPSEGDMRRFVDEMKARHDPGSGVSAQWDLPGIDYPDLPDVLNVSSCSGCYYASKLICRTVCSAFGAFLCGLLGVTVVGGIGCVAFVKGVCWVAERASGCGDDLAATLCKSSGLDVCGPNASGDIITADIPYV